MSQKPAAIHTLSANEAMYGWFQAYVRFLVSRDESLVLKVAPLALIGVLPMDIVSNIIPGIGLLDDAGYILIAIAVLFKTLARVGYYRRNPLPTRITTTR